MSDLFNAAWMESAAGGIIAGIFLLLYMQILFLYIKKSRFSRQKKYGNELLLKAMMSNSHTSDLVIDRENMICFASELFLQQFGLSEQEIYKVKVNNSQLPGSLKKFVTETEEGQGFIEPGLFTSIQPLFTEKGIYAGKLVRYEKRDNTVGERKKAIDLAHQINTPLNAISGYSELLVNEASLTKEQQKYVKIIRKHADILKNRIHHYMSDSKNPDIHQSESKIAGRKIEHILIVDDVTINRTLLRIMLTRKGYHVTEAANGQDGIASFKETKPDLILMDIQMPVMNGFEAVKLIRNTNQPNEHIPVIAVTASSVFDNSESIKKNGFDGLLRKPFKEKTLFKLIEQFTQTETEVL